MNNSSIFYWGVCSVCKGNESLRVCGRCKLIYYCSREHQKTHWSRHKNICKAINQMLVSCKLPSVFRNAFKCSSVHEWNNIRSKAALFTSLMLGWSGKLSPFEKQMFMFPKVCEVCKNDQAVSINCDQCLCVSYCSPNHQKEDIQHKEKCLSLKLCKALDLSVEDTSYLSYLNLLPNLLLKDQRSLQKMEEVLAHFCSHEEGDHYVQQQILCSELLSCPLTLLYSIDYVYKESLLKDHFTVHIVGASNLECSYPKVWDVIQKWFQLSPKFKIVFIGPEVVTFGNELNAGDIFASKENVKLEHYCGFYHDYIESEAKLCPDFIVAYNCGFQEFESSSNDTWRISLPYFFVSRNVHIILTSYTEFEAVRDLNILLSSSNKETKTVLKCIANPFCSKRPHRDWDKLRSDVFFINKFLSIVHVT